MRISNFGKALCRNSGGVVDLMEDMAMTYFDALETRSADQRASDQAVALQAQLERARSAPRHRR